jgi:IS5 family transposase
VNSITLSSQGITVTDCPIHEPSDSTLLWDSVRVLVRLLKRAEEVASGTTVIEYHNHRRVTKKRMRAIQYTRGQEKKARQVQDVAFHKKRGLKVDEMAKSAWVYRKLRNFRAGIEAGISCQNTQYQFAKQPVYGWALNRKTTMVL